MDDTDSGIAQASPVSASVAFSGKPASAPPSTGITAPLMKEASSLEQKRHDRGDFGRLAGAPQRDADAHRFLAAGPAVHPVERALGEDEAGAERVGADAVRTVVDRERSGQRQSCRPWRFRRRRRHGPRRRRPLRGDVDDRALPGRAACAAARPWPAASARSAKRVSVRSQPSQRHIGDGADLFGEGVVDEPVEAAEAVAWRASTRVAGSVGSTRSPTTASSAPATARPRRAAPRRRDRR